MCHRNCTCHIYLNHLIFHGVQHVPGREEKLFSFSEVNFCRVHTELLFFVCLPCWAASRQANAPVCLPPSLFCASKDPGG